MSVIKSLVIVMSAKTAAFEKGMKRSQRSMTGFQKTAAATSMAIKSLATSLGLFAAGAAAGSMVRSSFELIDATAKLSDRLNIATEDIIGLRHAAEIMGESAETMDKALEIFVRRLGEIRMGSGEAKRGLEALRLSADDLVKVSPAEAFSVIADRMEKMENQADKAATAYFLFGRQGTKLINTLSLGSDGLREMTEETERLGSSFNRLDASRVEEANDTMLRFRKVLTGISQSLTIGIAPAVTFIAETLIRTFDIISGVVNSIVGVGQVALASFTAAIGAVALLAEKISGIDFGASGAFLDLARDIKGLGDANLLQSLENFRNAFGLDSGIERFSGGVAEMADNFEEVAKGLSDAEREAQSFARTITSLLEGIKTPQEKFSDFLDIVSRGFKEGMVTAMQFDKLIEQAYDRIFDTGRIKNFADRIKQSLKGPIELLKDFNDDLIEAVEAGFLSMVQAQEAFRRRGNELFPQPELATAGGVDRRGRSEAIRTAFVSVAGLSSGARNPQVDEQKKTNALLEENNRTLQRIEDGGLR